MSSKKPAKDPEYVVVYSTDAPKCPGCHKEIPQCSCGKALLKARKPRVQIERKGRGGKSVTVVSQLPGRAELLKDLCSTCKRTLGVGGTHYIQNGEGFIEVQGEHLERVLQILQAYSEKGA